MEEKKIPNPSKQKKQPSTKPMEQVRPSITPTQSGLNKNFSAMLQGTGTNKLTRTSTRRTPPEIDEITGLARIASDSFSVFIEKYDKLAGGLRISTHKLLDMLTIELTAQNNYGESNSFNTLVSLPLVDYMDKCDIPQTKASRDKARRRVNEDLQALYQTSIEWTEPGGKDRPVKEFAKMRICDMVGVRNSKILINFSLPITQYLTNAYIMQYPNALFSIDERNPNAFYLGKKLMQHYSMDNNKKRGTNNILSVKKLLEHAPDIPTYDEVMQKDKHLDQRIISPFINALDSLNKVLTYEFCNRKGEPLSDEQLNDFTYDVFIRCYVKFDILDEKQTLVESE